MQVLDRLAQEELDDFEEFRRKNFNYLYYCDRCSRSFDSKAAEQNCRFCSGAIKELWSRPAAKKTEKTYRYFCLICDKNFVSREKPDACEICGSRFVHVYEWERLGRDVFRTRFKKFLKSARNLDSLLPKKKPARQQSEGERMLKLPQLQGMKLPKIKFPKNREELPTR